MEVAVYLLKGMSLKRMTFISFFKKGYKQEEIIFKHLSFVRFHGFYDVILQIFQKLINTTSCVSLA